MNTKENDESSQAENSQRTLSIAASDIILYLGGIVQVLRNTRHSPLQAEPIDYHLLVLRPRQHGWHQLLSTAFDVLLDVVPQRGNSSKRLRKNGMVLPQPSNDRNELVKAGVES